MKREPITVEPTDGLTIPRPDTGGTVVIKVSRDSSGGSMTVYESSRAAGDARGPAPHAHAGYDELFYVLAGEYEFVLSGTTVTATEGSAVFIPRGSWHSFRSSGRSDGRLLTVCTPGGIEDFFDELARAPEAATSVAAKHGVEFAD
ncbi:MAG: cupin domain-containing protein [Actinomycetota bacterium]